MSASASSTKERVDNGERLVSLSEAATILKMKRPNTAKYLARHGVEAAMTKASGYWWWASDIERLRKERESDPARIASDERRRQAALARVDDVAALDRLGPTQRSLLVSMLQRPAIADTSSKRHSMLRLKSRGFVEQVSGESQTYTLTEGGRAAAIELSK